MGKRKKVIFICINKTLRYQLSDAKLGRRIVRETSPKLYVGPGQIHID